MEIPRGGKFRCNHAPSWSKEMQERRRLPRDIYQSKALLWVLFLLPFQRDGSPAAGVKERPFLLG